MPQFPLMFLLLAALASLAAAASLDLRHTYIHVSSDVDDAGVRLLTSFLVPQLEGRGATVAGVGAAHPLPSHPITAVVLVEYGLEERAAQCAGDGDGGQCATPCLRSYSRHVEGGVVAAGPAAALLGRDSRALPLAINATSAVLLSAHDVTGLRAAAAALIRQLRHGGPSPVTAPLGLCKLHAPPPWLHMRGHQFSSWAFAFQPWPAAAEQYINDMVTFGTNQIELSHISWDPETVSQILWYSTALNDVAVNVSLWFTMDLFTGPGGANATQSLFQSMARLDSVFIPGGDGGEVLPPDQMMVVVGQIASVLRRYHPGASVWVSAQQYSYANLTALMQVIDTTTVRAFLTGLVYGPHVGASLLQFIAMTPAGYPVRQYPDICHTLKAQYEIPEWHSSFSFTEGRQVVIPLPRMQHNILSLRSNASYAPRLIGFGAYSEGAAADLNMALWSLLATDAKQGPADSPTLLPDAPTAVQEYCQHFFTSPNMSAEEAAGVVALTASAQFGLEANWAGDPGTNSNIDAVVEQLSAALALWPPLAANWRFLALQYRANYDALVKARVAFETSTVSAAYSVLADAGAVGVDVAIADAVKVLGAADQSPAVGIALAAMKSAYLSINSTVGLLVLQGQEPDLGISNVNASLGDTQFLLASLANISTLGSAGERLAAVEELVWWAAPPVPGSYYDALGSIDPAAHPRLDAGQGVATDPSFYFTPLQAFTGLNNNAPVAASRLSWRTFVQGFYDYQPTLRYTALNSTVAYELRVVMFSDGQPGDSAVPVRLTANGDTVLWGYSPPPYPMTVLSFPLPLALTAAGNLTIACNQVPGTSGSGRCCQLSEVWLLPTTD